MRLNIGLRTLIEALGLTWALGLALFTSLSFALYLGGVRGVVTVPLALMPTLVAIAVVTRLLWAARRDDDGAETSWDRPHRASLGEYERGPAGSRRSQPGQRISFDPATGALAVVMAVSGHAAWLALRAPLSSFDAWSIWAFKARMFLLGGPRPGYFHDLATLHTHPDYPLNLPLAEAALLRLPGTLGLSLAALLGPACLAALLLLFFAGLSRLHGAIVAAAATAALALVPALTAQSAGGDADVPLALYLGGAALYLLLWWRFRRGVDAVLMALLAGGAIWTKKEGLAVAALLLAAFIVGELRRHGTRRRLTGSAGILPAPRDGHSRDRLDVGAPRDTMLGTGGAPALPGGRRGRAGRPRSQERDAGGGREAGDPSAAFRELWGARAWNAIRVVACAVVLPLPWLLFTRLVHPAGRDFLPLTVHVFSTNAGRLPHIVVWFALQMLYFANWSLLWIVLAGVVLLANRRLSGCGRAMLALLLCQLGIYMLAFVFSDWQPYTDHLRTSVDRLLVQVTPLALLVTLEAVTALSARRARPAKAGSVTSQSAAAR